MRYTHEMAAETREQLRAWAELAVHARVRPFALIVRRSERNGDYLDIISGPADATDNVWRALRWLLDGFELDKVTDHEFAIDIQEQPDDGDLYRTVPGMFPNNRRVRVAAADDDYG